MMQARTELDHTLLNLGLDFVIIFCSFGFSHLIEKICIGSFGRLGFADLVWFIWLNRFALFPKFGLVDLVWYIELINWLAIN